jgi:titin
MLQSQLINVQQLRYQPYQPYIYPVIPSSVTQLAMATANVGVGRPPITCLTGKDNQWVTTFGLESPASLIVLSVTPENTQLIIQFTTEYITQYNTIASYQYSVNGGASMPFLPTGNNPYTMTVPGLVNGVTYSITLQSVNSIGSSAVVTSGTPAGPPSAPTIVSVTPGNQQLTIVIIPGGTNGLPITNYQYSTDGGTTYALFSPALGNVTTIVITRESNTGNLLTNGTTYTILLKSVTSVGSGNPSIPFPAIPATYPSAPTIVTLAPGNKQIVVNFTVPVSNGGSSITDYYYSTDNGSTYVASGYTSSPFTITTASTSGRPTLSDNTTYNILLTAYNIIGQGSPSIMVPATTFGTPSAPTIGTLTPGIRQIIVPFTAPVNNGGTTITNYYYSTDNGLHYIAYGSTVSPFTITRDSFSGTVLSNNTTYYILLKAYNEIGQGDPSNMVSATTFGTPSAPTIVTLVPGNKQIVVNFTAPVSNGGSAITDYYYSTDNGTTYVASGSTSSSFTITTASTSGRPTLSDNTTYYILLKAYNAIGLGSPSDMVSTTTFGVPGAPAIVTLVPGNKQIVVNFTAPVSNGGSIITNYYYSTDNGTTYVASGSTSSSFTITRASTSGTPLLTDGTTYYILLKAYNAIGLGSPSDMVSTTTFGVPSAPTIVTLTPGNKQIVVDFTAPVSNGGSAITNYYYSTDNGTTYVASGSTSSSFTITRASTSGTPLLTDGTTYYILLKAYNAIGLGSPSTMASATTFGKPNPPTAMVATPGDKQLVINFTPGSNNGSTITNYYYSTDNGSNYVLFSTPTGPVSMVTITTKSTGGPLVNGTTYTMRLKAVNDVGTGDASDSFTGTPNASATVPGAPTIGIITPTDQQLSVAFTAPLNDGGSAIEHYYYCTDGSTFVVCDPDVLSSPISITIESNTNDPLSNDTPYSIGLKAKNGVGLGPPSTLVPITIHLPDPPVITSIDPGDLQLTVNFTPGADYGYPITNYYYSTDGGSNYVLFSPATGPVSFVIITKESDTGNPLSADTTYTIGLQPVNSVGTGNESDYVDGTTNS